VGKGAFAEIFKATRKLDGKVYALKKIKLDEMTAKEKNNQLNEVRVLASI
jgi:NIMA (never in mitosis gene a)-related kinase